MNVQSPGDPQPAGQVKSQWHRSEHKGKESRAGLSLHRAAVGLDKHFAQYVQHWHFCALIPKHIDLSQARENMHRYWSGPHKRWTPTRSVAMPTCNRWAASDDPVFSISHQQKVAPSQRQLRGLCTSCIPQLPHFCHVSGYDLWEHANTFIFIIHIQIKSSFYCENVISFPFIF